MAGAEAGAKASNYPYLEPSWQSQNLLIPLYDKLQRGWLCWILALCECTMLSLEMRLWQSYRAVSRELIKHSGFLVEPSPLLFSKKWKKLKKKKKPSQNSSIWTSWQKESIHLSQWAVGPVFLQVGGKSQYISVNRQLGLSSYKLEIWRPLSLLVLWARPREDPEVSDFLPFSSYCCQGGLKSCPACS